MPLIVWKFCRNCVSVEQLVCTKLDFFDDTAVAAVTPVVFHQEEMAVALFATLLSATSLLCGFLHQCFPSKIWRLEKKNVFDYLKVDIGRYVSAI